MENKNNIPENFKNDSDFLSKIEKKNNFSVPNDYFEQLPQVINNKKLNNSSIKFYFDKLSYRVLIPISAFILITILVLNWNDNTLKNELTNEQISEFLLEEEDEYLDENLIYETYYQVMPNEISMTNEEEKYIDYLIENDIDVSTIIEEL